MHQVDDVAVKVCKILNKQSLDPFKREIELISKLHHRNVLQFYGACLNANNIFMVTELMDVDLFTALKSDPKVLWSGEYGWNIARDIALGMNYLHRREPTVVHRDLKSSNVLLHRLECAYTAVTTMDVLKVNRFSFFGRFVKNW